MKLEFWFEFGSTYSHPAALRIEPLAAKYGVALEWRAFLLGPIFADAPWLPEFVRAVYRANFEHDRDIASPAVVEKCLAVAGSDAARLLAEAQTPDAKKRLREQTERAVALDIFGAPSFVVGDELFWGNDRLEDALALATGAPD